MTDKYRVVRAQGLWPWRVYPPGSEESLGSFDSQERAMWVAEGHARGAGCSPFLMGYCRCRFECAQ
jgi:hypothetical protein